MDTAFGIIALLLQVLQLVDFIVRIVVRIRDTSSESE